jgi:hypothetical protein
MRWLVVCALVLSIPGAFFLGRETAGTTRAEPKPAASLPGAPNGRDIRLRFGDVVTFPQAATRCFATAEAAFPRLYCEPTGLNASYAVDFYTDEFLVFHGPDNVPFSGRWAEFASFVTPDRAAYCGVWDGGYLMCWRPRDGLTLSMSRRGRPQRILDSNYRGYHDPESEPVCCYRRPSRVLPFGRSWARLRDWTCVSRATGLTCTNRAGHGWWLGRKRGSQLF